jgi:hypothetical protein
VESPQVFSSKWIGQRDISTEHYGIFHEIWWFPVIFPLSIESRTVKRRRSKQHDGICQGTWATVDSQEERVCWAANTKKSWYHMGIGKGLPYTWKNYEQK